MSNLVTVDANTGEVAQYDDDLPTALRLPVGLMPKAQQSGKFGAGWKPEGGKGYPIKSDKFVAMHPDREMAGAVAVAFGGEVEEVTDKMMRPATQFRVKTKTSQMDVMLSTSGAFTSYYEVWTEGGVAMRTDGRTNLVTGTPLPHPCPDPDLFDSTQEAVAAAKAWAKANGDLKLTTRFQVTPLDLPSLNPWKVETHGWIAAATFADVAEKLLVFARMGIPFVQARLTLTNQRGNEVLSPADVEKRKGQKGVRTMLDGQVVGTANFVLWGLEIVTQTPREMLTLSRAATARALEVAEHRHVLAIAEESEATAKMVSAHKSTHTKNVFDPDDPFPLGDDRPKAKPAAPKKPAAAAAAGEAPIQDGEVIADRALKMKVMRAQAQAGVEQWTLADDVTVDACEAELARLAGDAK